MENLNPFPILHMELEFTGGKIGAHRSELPVITQLGNSKPGLELDRGPAPTLNSSET